MIGRSTRAWRIVPDHAPGEALGGSSPAVPGSHSTGLSWDRNGAERARTARWYAWCFSYKRIPDSEHAHATQPAPDGWLSNIDFPETAAPLPAQPVTFDFHPVLRYRVA